MSVSDEILDNITGHSVDLLRVDASIRKKVVKQLKSLEASLIDELEKAELGEIKRTPVKMKRLKKLLEVTKKTISSAYKEIDGDLLADLSGLAEVSELQAVDAINQALQVDVLSVGMSQEMLESIVSESLIQGAPSSEWWSRQADNLQIRFKDVVREGMLRGDTTAEIVRKVIGTKARNYRDGIMNATRKQAESIVRTSVQTVANNARKATYQNNDDIVKGVEWASTLDGRTSTQCFVGGTEVVPVGDVEKLFKRHYSGKFVTVTTSSGKKITGTPNHPILTNQGWCSLDEIDPSKHIVYSVSFDRIEVTGEKSVGVPASISKLYNAVYESSISKIELLRSTADDFHGDGQAGDSDVGVLSVNGRLSYSIKSSVFNFVGNKLLSFIQDRQFLSSNSLPIFSFFGRSPAVESSKRDIGSFENGINSGLAPTVFSNNFAGSSAFVELIKYLRSFIGGNSANFPSSKMVHNTEAFKQIGHSGDGGGIVFGNVSGGLPASVSCENIIDKRVEFKSCHIYNLQMSTGLYIANGLLVKNCKALDGLQWDMDNKPVGHNKQLIGPAAHWQCRSTLIPVLKSWEELGAKGKFEEIPKGTRASMDGQVSAGATYEEWLRKKDEPFQIEVLGKTKYQLWKDGKISFTDLVDMRGNPLTVEELKKKYGT